MITHLTRNPRLINVCNVKPTNTLRDITTGYGFDNPGPIMAFGPNAFLISGHFAGGYSRPVPKNGRRRIGGYDTSYSADLAPNEIAIRDGADRSIIILASEFDWDKPLKMSSLYIPWTIPQLEAFIEFSRKRLVEIVRFTNASVNELNRELKKIKEVFFTVDIIAAILTAFVGTAALGVQGAKSAADLGKIYKAMLLHVGVSQAGMLKDIGMKVLDDLQGETGSVAGQLPKKQKVKNTGASYWLDNTLGWITPSKIARAYVVLIEDEDPDLLWDGPQVASAKRANAIIDSSARRIKRIEKQIQTAKDQLQDRYYKHRVEDI